MGLSAKTEVCKIGKLSCLYGESNAHGRWPVSLNEQAVSVTVVPQLCAGGLCCSGIWLQVTGLLVSREFLGGIFKDVWV